MDLWIRSQDKEKLVECNKVELEPTLTFGMYTLKTTNDNCSIILGNYKTKERALEVLDNITKNLCYRLEFGHPYNNNFVYEMSEE